MPETQPMIAQFWVRSMLIDEIRAAQITDTECQKVIDRVRRGQEKRHKISNEMLMLDNRASVPNANNLRQRILQETHYAPYSVHPGATKMYHDIKTTYWWSGLKKEVAKFVASCLTYQQVKIEHQKPTGLLQEMPLPEWKWDRIAMDFVVGLPRTQRGYDSIWVIVDRLTKSAHFLPIKTTNSVAQYAQLYIKHIVSLHGVPISIISDRGT